MLHGAGDLACTYRDAFESALHGANLQKDLGSRIRVNNSQNAGFRSREIQGKNSAKPSKLKLKVAQMLSIQGQS
jgi:hypothetical protein